MAKTGISYFDQNGRPHATPDAASIVDLATQLEVAPHIAARILARRAQVETIFADHEAMLADRPNPLKIVSGGAK